MKSLTVQIPKPCHERWTDMLPTEQGRFCASCQKTVVDYTALSDRELFLLLNQAAGTACGRFRNDQLNRPLVSPNQTTSPVWQRWLSVLTMGLLGWQTAQAQVKQPGNSMQLASEQSIQSLKPRLIEEEVMPGDSNRIINGRVLLSDSAGAVAVVSYATVLVKTIDPHIPTRKLFMSGVTDSDGRFNLLIPANWPINNLTLDVFTSGFTVHEVRTNVFSATTAITLSDVLLSEKMCVKRITISAGGLIIVRSPSRWQRLKRKFFHRAG